MGQRLTKRRFLNIDFDTLIKGCRQNDSKCQQQLYKLYYPEMIKVCCRYASDADGAGIIFNNAMLRVFKSIDRYNDEGKLRGWIKTIVINCCIDFSKKKNIFRDIIPDVHESAVIFPAEVFDHISGKEISRLIKELPAATATVFNLYVYEGFTHKQIATLLGISDGTSKWHVSEAKKLLKIKLEKISKTELKANVAG